MERFGVVWAQRGNKTCEMTSKSGEATTREGKQRLILKLRPSRTSARTHTHPSCREAKMFHATHRFLFPKVFAFTLVLLATTLFSVALLDAQVTGEPTECWSNCHAEATDYYNNSSAPTKVKQYVASQLMNDCLEENLC